MATVGPLFSQNGGLVSLPALCEIISRTSYLLARNLRHLCTLAALLVGGGGGGGGNRDIAILYWKSN